MKQRYILSAITALVIVAGCATKAKLDPAGVYAGNAFLYNCDKVLVESKATLDRFVTFEWQNRAQLASNKLQAVTVAADSVRSNAPIWFALAGVSRAAYTNLLFTIGSSVTNLASASNAYALSVSAVSGQADAVSAIHKSVTK